MLNMVSLPPQNSSKNHRLRDDLKVGAILRVLWFNKVLLLSAFIVTFVAAAIYSLNIEKLYKAEALIKIKQLGNNTVKFSDESDDVANFSQIIESNIVYLHSQEFLKKIATDLNLTSDPEFLPKQDVELTQNSEPASQQAPDRKLSDNEFGLKAKDLALVAENLREHLDVRQLGNSYVVAVNVTSSDPKKATVIANTIASAFLSSQLAQMKDSADVGIEWLGNRIGKLRGELASIEGQIINYQSSHQIDVGELGGSLATQKAELAAQLALIKANRSGAVARRNFTRNRIETVGALPAARGILTPAMATLRSREVNVMRGLSEASKEYGNRHPVMLNLQQELQAVRERMEAEANRALYEQDNEVAVSLAREQELKAQVALLDRKTTKGQKASIALDDLKRGAETNKKLLTTYLTRHAELLEWAQIFEANAEIMSPASIPTTPYSPNPLGFSLMIACSAILATCIGVFFHDRWISDFGFKSTEELIDFDIESLGIIPDLPERESRESTIEDYVLANPQSAQAIACQYIRTRIYRLNRPQETVAQSVMITSSLPLEGKTTAAVILARQAAEAGLRTLLIDADLHRPRVSDVLGLAPKEGLGDLLAGNTSSVDTVVEDPKTPLHFLSAGLQTLSPSDLFREKRMSDLMSILSQTYDWIIVDTPPIGAVSDCLTIGQHVTHCVYVARWRSTPRNVILSGMRQIEETGTVISGMILSRAKSCEQRKYGVADLGQHYGRYQSNKLAEVA